MQEEHVNLKIWVYNTFHSPVINQKKRFRQSKPHHHGSSLLYSRLRLRLLLLVLLLLLSPRLLLLALLS